MNHQVVIAIAAVTAYIVWLIVFILVSERWLRQLTGQLFGVTITRELQTYSGPSSNISILDVLDAYRWKVTESASFIVRFAIGFLRVGFWSLAVVTPLLIGFLVIVARHRQQ